MRSSDPAESPWPAITAFLSKSRPYKTRQIGSAAHPDSFRHVSGVPVRQLEVSYASPSPSTEAN